MSNCASADPRVNRSIPDRVLGVRHISALTCYITLQGISLYYLVKSDTRGKMTERHFIYVVGAIGLAFTLVFSITVAPLLIQNLDLLEAIAAGFVNPYSTGFTLDTLSSWLVLTIWIAYEAKTLNVRYGWVAVLLGLIPGTVMGLAFYLILRAVQLKPSGRTKA